MHPLISSSLPSEISPIPHKKSALIPPTPKVRLQQRFHKQKKTKPYFKKLFNQLLKQKNYLKAAHLLPQISKIDPYTLSLKKGWIEVSLILAAHCQGTKILQRENQPSYFATAIKGDNLRLTEALVQSGMSPNFNFGKQTALSLAAHHNRLEIAHLLVQKGAEINGRNQKGQTPLHIALYEGHLKIASWLIDKGASLITDDQGNDPFQIAYQKGLTPILIQLFNRLKSEDANSPLLKNFLPHLYTYRQNFSPKALAQLIANSLPLDLNSGPYFNVLAKAYIEHSLPFIKILEKALQKKGIAISQMLNSEQNRRLIHLFSTKKISPPPRLVQRWFEAPKTLSEALSHSPSALYLTDHCQAELSAYLKTKPKLTLKQQLNLLGFLSPSKICRVIQKLSEEEICHILQKKYPIERGHPSAMQALFFLIENAQLYCPLYSEFRNLMGNGVKHLPPKVFALATRLPEFKPFILPYLHAVEPQKQAAIVPFLSTDLWLELMQQKGAEIFLKLATRSQKKLFLEKFPLKTQLPALLQWQNEKKSLKKMQLELETMSAPKVQLPALKEQFLAKKSQFHLALEKSKQLLNQFAQALKKSQSTIYQLNQKLARIENWFARREKKVMQLSEQYLKPIPDAFICPISGDIMANPLTYQVNHVDFVIDEQTWQALKREGDSFTCPFTTQTVTEIQPATQLKQEIAAFLSLN